MISVPEASCSVVDQAEVFTQLVSHYKNWLLVSNKAASTRDGYVSDLHQFRDWLDVTHDVFPAVGEITTDDLIAYMSHLNGRDLAPRTIRRAMSSISSWFGWLTDVRSFLDRHPARRLPLPKIPFRLPSYLSPQLVPELLSLPDTSHWLGLRDRALLATLALSGIRRATASALDVADVRRDRKLGRHFRVIVKGNHEHLLPINSDLATILDDYLDARPVTEDPALFLTTYRLRMSGNAIYERVGTYGRRLSESLHLHPHMLRHTFATWLYEEDVHLVDMKELLCHACISSTQVYLHTNPRRLRASVERLRAFDAALA